VDNKTAPVIHIAKIYKGKGRHYLYLRKVESYHYVWYDGESPTSIFGGSVADALLSARKHWSLDSFETVNCGFRYSLPERDEHGINALFSEMAASYSSMNGVYFDPDLGYNCFVQNASLEARDLLKTL
jgi:hypothetical protein